MTAIKGATRRLTLTERRVFRAKIGLIGPFARLARALLIVLVFVGVLSGLGAFLQDEYPAIKGSQNQILGSIFVAATIVAVWFDSRCKYPRHARNFVEELRKGVGLVQQFEVTDAIRMEELEDNGYAFYLRLSDERVLFLMGQYLYELADKGEFPSSKVQIVVSPVSRLVLSIRCLGVPIPVSAKIPAPTLHDFDSGRVPADGEILTMNFNSLKRRVG